MVYRVLPLVMLAFVGTSLQPNVPLQQQGPQAGITTLHARTQLVVVDVVVMDKNKQPVHGLKAKDFSLLENGTGQTFKSFEEHVAPSPADAVKPVAMPKLPPGTFTNFSPVAASDNGPLNILLLDRLNTPVANQAEMQKQINEFLATARAGTRMAIFGLTDHLILLQGFTDDPALLRAAVVKGGYYTSPLRDQRIGEEGNSESLKSSDILANAMSGMGNSPQEAAAAVNAMKQFENVNTAAQTITRVQFSLDALNALARYLAAFPGRKNLIWFSGSFPLDILPDITKTRAPETGKPPTSQTQNSAMFNAIGSKDKEFEQTTALLSRSQVAVYPIDAKGLANEPTVNAANVATSTGLSGRPAIGTTTLQDMLSSGEERVDEHDMMYAMADRTGGKAAVDTNGLKEAVENAIANGSNYYTIAYAPTNTNWNGDFRKIEVKLRGQGYSLSYRKGYLAFDTDTFGGEKSTTVSAGSHAMVLAMTHGAPAPTQIVFTARVQPVSAATEATIAPGNKAGKGDTAPYRRYQVDFAFQPEQVRFTQTADGHRHVSLEFVTGVYDAEGNMVDSIGKTIQADLVPEAYAQFRQSGVPYREEVSVPTRGEYFLRIAVHQTETDHVGAVEVPVASVSGLAPGMAAR